MSNIVSNGALPDTRPQVAKDKDYPAEYVTAGAAVTFANPKPTVLGATLYSQEYVQDCVPHGFYTQLEYEGIVPTSGMSQTRAYRKRSNYPNPGSDAVDLYTKIRNGQSANSDAPTTPNMTEAMANAMALVAGSQLIKDFNYYGFTDYSLVPQAVASGKAIAIFIFATEDEWSQEYVTVRTPNLDISKAYVRHCVCIMPRGDFTENGQKWLAVQDSAAFGGRHLRYMSFDFFLKRCYYASQVFEKGTVPPPPAFHYTFTKQLKYNGASNDAKEVHALQQALQYLKRADGSTYMTPGNFGPYGPATKKAVGLFQSDNGITDPDGQGTNFGPSTRTAMNKKLL